MSKFVYYVVDNVREFHNLVETMCNGYSRGDGCSGCVLEDFLHDHDGVAIIGVDHIKMEYDLVDWEELSKEEILSLKEVPFYNPLIITKYDPVNHPSHYNQSPIEIIDIIERATEKMDGFRAYCFGNVLKYMLRAPYKGNTEQDHAKAFWYWERMGGGGE